MAHVILLSVDCGPESEKLRSGSYLACLPSSLDEDDKAPISVGEMHNDIELARSHALAVLLFEGTDRTCCLERLIRHLLLVVLGRSSDYNI